MIYKLCTIQLVFEQIVFHKQFYGMIIFGHHMNNHCPNAGVPSNVIEYYWKLPFITIFLISSLMAAMTIEI